tara:strand:+ start:535 stop:747 length:213 start_codon:yes stop_codon:yes gene_type:complete
MTEYRIECHVQVNYDAFIHAESLEEANEIAEKQAGGFNEFDKDKNNFFNCLDEQTMYIDKVYATYNLGEN